MITFWESSGSGGCTVRVLMLFRRVVISLCDEYADSPSRLIEKKNVKDMYTQNAICRSLCDAYV